MPHLQIVFITVNKKFEICFFKFDRIFNLIFFFKKNNFFKSTTFFKLNVFFLFNKKKFIINFADYNCISNSIHD